MRLSGETLLRIAMGLFAIAMGLLVIAQTAYHIDYEAIANASEQPDFAEMARVMQAKSRFQSAALFLTTAGTVLFGVSLLKKTKKQS